MCDLRAPLYYYFRLVAAYFILTISGIECGAPLGLSLNSKFGPRLRREMQILNTPTVGPNGWMQEFEDNFKDYDWMAPAAFN